MQEYKKRSTLQITLVLTTITIVCKILGFLKNSLLAYYFGTSPVVDAYVMTFSIGTITCGWVAGLIGNFTPVFKKIESENGVVRALKFAGNVHSYIFGLVLLFAGILGIIAPTVVKIIAPGFNEITYNYTVHFFRLYLISIVFYSSYRFGNEFLHCNQRHIAASAPDVVMSTCCIISIIGSSYLGESFLIYGYVIALLLQCVITICFSYKIGFKILLKPKWDENMNRLLIMAVPIFLSNTLAEINTLVDKMFASKLTSGTVAALDYANTMKEFLSQIGTMAIVAVIFPIFSKLWAEGDVEAFKDKVMQLLQMLAVLYIPVTAGVIAIGDLIIEIVFKRGQFDDKAAFITTNAFIIYSLALFALSLRGVFLKAFYSMQKTRYILMVSGANVFLNVFLNFILVKHYGYIGLALATSIAALSCLPIYFYCFRREIPSVRYRSFLIKCIKSLVASIGMFFIIHQFKINITYLFDKSLVGLALLIVLLMGSGLIIYILIGLCIKIEEVEMVVKYIRGKILTNRNT